MVIKMGIIVLAKKAIRYFNLKGRLRKIIKDIIARINGKVKETQVKNFASDSFVGPASPGKPETISAIKKISGVRTICKTRFINSHLDLYSLSFLIPGALAGSVYM